MPVVIVIEGGPVSVLGVVAASRTGRPT